MSELKRAKSQSREEEELLNLLKVQETTEDILEKVDNVVNSTENYLYYITDHRINDTYSKILDELMEEPNFTNSSKPDQKKDNLDNQQHRRLVEGVDKTVGKGGDLLHIKDACKETISSLSLEKEVNFEPSLETLKQTKSVSPQETNVCCENQQYFSKIEEFPLHQVKTDDVGIKRPMPSSPKDDHHTCDKILSKSLKNLCKKRKVDFSDDCVNELTIQQKRSINMDIKLARINFRGPLGIATDSIAVILDTEKPSTSYKHPIRKPEYKFSRITSAKLKKAGKQISLIVYSTKEYRKVTASPCMEDYIELTDTFLTQELDEEYSKIVQGGCSNIMKEEHNFLNSPNRTIKLIEHSSASSTDSSEGGLTKKFLGNTMSDEKQECSNFGEGIRTQNYEKTLPEKQQNLRNNADHHLLFQTKPEIQDSILFPDILPLQIQTNVEILNIRKDANCGEEHLTQFFNSNVQDNSESSDSACKSIPCDLFDVSSSQSNTSSDAFSKTDKEIKTNENISDELAVYSPSKFTPFSSSVPRVGASLTNLESDILLSDMYEDQNDMSRTLGTDDLEGDNLMTICKDNTFLNNEPANTVPVSKKIEENVGSVVLPVQTVELDNNFEIMPGQINNRQTTVLNIDPNLYSCREGRIGNNFKQTNEADSSSLGSNNINNAVIFTTPNNDFDNEGCDTTTDSIVCENFVFSPTEPCTKSTLKNFKINYQNITFNDPIVVSFNAEHASCSQEADATIEIVEENLAKSLNNQTVSDFNMSGLINTPEFNNDDIVYLSDSDTEANMCKTDDLKEKSIIESVDTQNKVTVSLTDSENNFSSNTKVPQESYKIEHVAKFTYNQDDDIIYLSDSTTCSCNEFVSADNAVPYGNDNVKEKNISACPINQHDVVSLSDSDDCLSNDNTKPFTTNALTTTNVAKPCFNQPEDVTDLGNSCSDSVISINSDSACSFSKEESTTKSYLDGQDDTTICDSSNTSVTVSISCNHSMLSLIDYSTNVRSNGEGISDQNQNMVYKTAETNKEKSFDEINFGNVVDFSNDINFENFFIQNDTTTACNSISDTILSRYTNISKNMPESSASLEIFDRENTGDDEMGISDTHVNEETASIATKKSEDFQEKIPNQNQGIAAISDITRASTSTSHFVPNSINTSNNYTKIGGSDNMGPDKSEEFYANENIPPSENFKHTQSFSLDNESVGTVTVYDAESSSNSLPYTTDLKEVDDLCDSNDPNYHNEGTSTSSLTNVDTLASSDAADVATSNKVTVANIFASKNILTSEPVEDQSKSSNIEGVPKIFNTETVGIENYGNTVISPKTSSTIEPIGIIDTCLLSPYNQHSSNHNISTTFLSSGIISASAVSDLKISQNNENNVSKVDLSSALDITKPKTSPLTTEKTENIMTNMKILELPYINSNIGKRPSLVNQTSHNVPNLNLDNTSQTENIMTNMKILELPYINSNIGKGPSLVNQTSHNVPNLNLDNTSKTENIMTNMTKILELPYINSDIGIRPSLVNQTSHNVPNLNLDNASQTYVPTININANYISFCDNNIDVNQNCTITSSVCSTVNVRNGTNEYKLPEKFTKTVCDTSEKDLTMRPEVLNTKLQANSLSDVASNSLTRTSSTTSHNLLKHDTTTHDRSTKVSSKSKTLKHSTHTTNTGKTTTGVKRPPSTNKDESNKRYKSSSSNNLLTQTQPTISKNDAYLTDNWDANEIADNNDPKWKLFNFSEPRDFFLAVRNQWCTPMPNPHIDLTRRFYNSRPTNSSNYLIPGNQRDLNVECLATYEEQLHQINTESINLKHSLDTYGSNWDRRRINYTINKLKKLDNMHDTLREAWDDAYHFYKFFKDSKTNYNAWYMSQFNKNEIARSLDMLHAYEDYYGCTD